MAVSCQQDMWISPRHNGFVKPTLRQTDGEERTAKLEGITDVYSPEMPWNCLFAESADLWRCAKINHCTLSEKQNPFVIGFLWLLNDLHLHFYVPFLDFFLRVVVVYILFFLLYFQLSDAESHIALFWFSACYMRLAVGFWEILGFWYPILALDY